jgi:CubicO group peptidase (beta-lactamase class C family)
MTKPLIGAAVQILIDEGRLSLDDTAAKYLPSFDNDKSRGITVRQLLTHTGGLPLSSILGSNFHELASLRGVADTSGMNGPTIPPGSGFQYSDDGADTLGAIVSVVTGQPAEAFIAKRILEPLGMKDTFPLVSVAGGKLNRFASSYMGSRDNWVRFWSPEEKPIFPYFLASQGMYSTAEDYARFLAMYLDEGRTGGKRVLSAAAVKRTLEPAIAGGLPSGFPGLSGYYGQMMVDYVDSNKKLVAFGHAGSDGTWAYAWPEHDLMVLYFTQSRGNMTGLELETAIDRLLLGGSQAAPIAQGLTAESAAPYLGLYWLESQQKPLIVVLEKDRLALEIPWQGLVELKQADEPNLWSIAVAPNMSVKFHRAGAGPAEALEFRQGSPATLKRFEPEGGLPTLDELFMRRPDQQRAEKLASLGTIRMSGHMELSLGQQKGSFELLSSGDDHSRTTVRIAGAEIQQVSAGDRAWMKPGASMPFQELPAAMGKSMRLNGWLFASGGWRGEFNQARVLKRVELEGQPVFLVHAAPEQGRQRLIYLHAENGLTLGYDEVQDVPGAGMVGCEVRFTDYRDIGGVQIPLRTTAKYSSPMLGTHTYQVDETETRLTLKKDPFTIK